MHKFFDPNIAILDPVTYLNRFLALFCIDFTDSLRSNGVTATQFDNILTQFHKIAKQIEHFLMPRVGVAGWFGLRSVA